MSNFPACEKTGKVRFPGRGTAEKAREGKHARLRAYRCRSCGGWHLTSQVRDVRVRPSDRAAGFR